ncbi:MAG: aminotransferase class V-fold PLP-dependent enzyme [Pseudomonadales bacterium]|jgi:glutamate/tyrosine decarboxylase-like PLP-dependent enzyme
MTTFDPENPARAESLAILDSGFDGLPDFAPAVLDADDRAVLRQVAGRLTDNYPYHHPLYAGQMLKPPHPLAREAYALAMRLNPNNHALDGGRASSAMEKEAVAALAAMVGFPEHLGHLTGGGTMANLEALWVAGRSRPGKRVVASAHAHYTHSRISGVLGLAFESIAVDAHGRMDLDGLAAAIDTGGVGTVVATLGTTGLGAVDPLADILRLAAKAGIRVHVDAAYGGYFRLLGDWPEGVDEAFAALGAADSVVIDPHKHGLQPYGCGCVLFRDPAVGQFYRHDSPYTYFTSRELHLGEISLECSRAGAAAVALWATQTRLPLIPDGEFAAGLAAGRDAARALQSWLAADVRFLTLPAPDLDIVVFAPAGDGSAAGVSAASQRLFEVAAADDLHLALIRLPAAFLARHWPALGGTPAGDVVTCLRACLMKPEHRDWLPRIFERLAAGVDR